MDFNFKSFLITFLIALPFSLVCNSQVGIGTMDPEAGAALDISSTNSGLLIPRVNISNLLTIAPIINGSPTSLLVYNTNVTTGEGFYYWNGNRWVSLNRNWKLEGNSGTNPSVNFIGTIDNTNLNFRTNNSRRMEITTDGVVFINPDGTATEDPLDVNGDIEIGGGALFSDNDGENVFIRAQSESWYLSVANESEEEDSDFFIGTSSESGNAYFIITQDTGYVGIGEDDSNPNDKLHVTDDQNETTAIRIDNTNSGGSTALLLYDGSSEEAFFRHNNTTDVLELGNNDDDGAVHFYSDGDIAMTLDLGPDGGGVGGNSNVNVVNDLNVGGQTEADSFKLSALNTAPASSGSAGTTGEIRIVNGFIYVCVATNTWKRAALTTF